MCEERFASLQMHHLDENPSNNELDNLVALCPNCHSSAHSTGGLGRKLDAEQIKLHKERWIKRIEERRNKADSIASLKAVVDVHDDNIESFAFDNPPYRINDDPKMLIRYLEAIVPVRDAQREVTKIKWNSGVTAKMNQGSSDMIDFYEGVLVELATFYPQNHFDQNPKEYINEVIRSLAKWYRFVLEPEGGGKGGTIVSNMVGGSMMSSVEDMVIDVVVSLLFFFDDREFDLKEWKRRWKE